MFTYHLPNEIWTHIISFVEDKIGLSMTCKLFQQLLKNMYASKKVSNINDSYYLKKLNRCEYLFIIDIINKIHNHNCLNLIMSKIILSPECSDRIYIFLILSKAYMINANYKPQYIQKLAENLGNCSDIPLTTCFSLMKAFPYNAYGILKIMMDSNVALKCHIGEILLRRHFGEKNIHMIIKDVEKLVVHKIITYDELGHQILIQNMKGVNIFLMKDLYLYMDKYVSVSMKEQLLSM